MEVLWAVVGLLVGVVVAWIFLGAKARTLESLVSTKSAQFDAAEVERKALAEKAAEHMAEATGFRVEAETVRAKLEERERAHEQRLQDVKAAKEEMANQFKAMSSTALGETTKQFLLQAEQVLKTYQKAAEGDDAARKSEIDALLQPVKDNLTKLEEHNQDMERRRTAAYHELLEQVGSLKTEQAGLTKETTRLVKALQDPGSAGSWGEMALERVMEMAGLEAHWSYLTQETIETDQGKQRLDVLVQLPGGRSLIVDSKAPMRHYMEALETEEGPNRSALMVEHANKLIGHVRDMKKRGYEKSSASTPDFIVLFVPSESAYRAAADARPALFEEAASHNVLVVTPMSLLPLLKAVAYGWQQEKLAQSAFQLQKDALELYERIAKLSEHYDRLGKSLKSACTHFNSLGGSLDSRVLATARKLKSHGVQSTSELAVVEPVEFAPRRLQGQEPAGQHSVSLPGLDEG